MLFTKKNKIQSIVEDMYVELDSRIKNSSSDCYYLNLGYWKDTTNIKVACEQMIDKVISFADIKDNQVILDAGFGYGDQDIYIATKIPKLKIFGINIVDHQVQKAQNQVIQNNFSDRLFLQKGDAVSLNFDDNTFDSVIAIESAFHFNTREKFFREAYRTLKKNGTLCLTDCLPVSGNKNAEFQKNSERFGIPMDNQYELHEYISKLKKIGFKSIIFEDISDNVIPYSAMEICNKKGWRTESTICLPDNKDRLADLIKNFNRGTTIEKYIIIKAVK